MENTKTTDRLVGSRLYKIAAFAVTLLLVAATSHAAENASLRYRVQKGDTLGSVAKRFSETIGDWREIQRANRLKNPHRIEPGSTLRIPYKILKQTPISATIAFATGAVEHRPAGATAKQPLKQGNSVNEGDQIFTGATGTATVDFHDGSQLVILRDSTVGFAQIKGRSDIGMASIQIDLKQGRVETRVTPRKFEASRYEIITPTVQIGVRGTEFRVKLDEANAITRTEVLHGIVAADNALGGVSVPQGFGTLIEKDQAPRPPVALLPPPGMPYLLMTTSSSTLHWAPVNNAVAYRLIFASDAAFANRIAEYSSRKPEIQIAQLPTGRYFVRAVGVDAIGLEGIAQDRSIDF